MSQIAATALKAAAEAPLFAHGDEEANPNPDPSASKISVAETAATVPAKMAAQETADFVASTPRSAPEYGVSIFAFLAG
jgi:hypothetical protein